MKKTFALILITVLLFCFGISASADTDAQAALYNYYGDNMLFKQNDDAVFAGKAAAGTEIVCTLLNSEDVEIASATTTALADGTFSLSFTAPSGSFEEYTVTLSANGEVFDELTGVVFGELWLAGGQSNMQMSLGSSAEGSQMIYNNERGSNALRFFHVPYMGGTYNGDQNYFPALPLTDYQCEVGWYKGSDIKVFDLSAVGYYFAENLIKELNMPVGVLNANMGGTSIYTWLSRNAIESNAEVLADCKSDNRYIPLSNWNEQNINFGFDMTCNFNKIIAPLKNFRLSGMIWYQGEGDVSWAYGRYTRAFNALQESYTTYFNHKNGPLPIVLTQLASYSYGILDALQLKNVEFTAIQQQDPSSRAVTSILDVPLDYTVEVHPIHPLYKKPVGDKMAYAAKGLVYGLHDSYTVATPQKVEIKNSSVYVTFRDVGDTLMVDGETLSAFSICSSNGVYVPAKAELISADKVRVYSPSVLNPVSAAYACSQSNGHANLYASRNGEKLLAVSPFITDINYRAHIWQGDWWTTCDFETFWHCHNFTNTGYHPSWESTNSSITYSKSEIDTGNALYIKSNGSNPFTILPKQTYAADGTYLYYEDVDYNWSDYKTLTFKVKVKSGNPVHFDGLMLTINDQIWVAPAIKDSNLVGTMIPADGNVHTITLDLDRLYPLANINAESYKSNVLGIVFRAEFVFSDSAGGSAEICFDDVAFGTDALNFNSSDSAEPAPKPSFFERIKAFFVSIYTKIVLFFDRLFKW